MMNFSNADYSEINLSDISDDEFFRVSRKNYQNTLPSSLKLSGMLEIPYLVKKGSCYCTLTCHNRIKILRESGISQLNCYVLEEPDAEVFMNYVSLKVYRNEIGPVGKFKSLLLLKSFFSIDEKERKDYCTKILKLPHEIIENEVTLKKVMDFSDSLLFYIDEKDINFKIIKDLSLLPSDWIALIDKWVKNIQVRVNIFRMLVDNVFDIHRRGDSIQVFELLSCNDDKSLYDAVYQIRYPEFSKLKMKSESIISELSGAGLTIEFPEYFDKKFVTVRIDINKNADCNDQLKKISNVSVEKMKELLSLL